MDYFVDVLGTFLGLDRVHYCLWKVRKLSDFIKNILICVQKMNEGLMVWNDMGVSNQWQNFHFWVNYPFKA